jgi:beta-glucanase (GH16 family)
MFKSKYLLLVLAVVLVLGITLLPSHQLHASSYVLNPSLSDEFNYPAGTTIDTGKWYFETEGHFNGEAQQYTDYQYNVPAGSHLTDYNLMTTGSTIQIVARNQSLNGYNYTSCRINSKNRMYFTYAKTEFRMKPPAATVSGLWPAVWTLGNNISEWPLGEPPSLDNEAWPKCGENDMWEYQSSKSTSYITNGFSSTGMPASTRSDIVPGNQAGVWRIYVVEWTQTSMSYWYREDTDADTVQRGYVSKAINASAENAYRKDMFYLINVAVGGTLGSPINCSFPQTLEVDYIRTYQLDGPANTPTPVPPKSLPGKIEAENYDAMSGVQTEATSDTGGGMNVGWIDLNDWMDYSTIIQQAGAYQIDYRVSSPNATGKVDFRVNSVTLATTTIPNTGGWQAWTTVSANVNLSAGTQTIRLVANVGGWNINWFQGTVAGPTPTPGPTATPAPTPTTGPTPTPLPGGSLLSQGKTATASSFQAGNEVAKGNDGSTSTRWAASGATFPQWWKVDLGASYNLSRVDINWYLSASRSYKYKIEVSADNVTFTTVVDKTGNTTLGDTSDSISATGRYVRITITGTSAGWASAYEFKVYGN